MTGNQGFSQNHQDAKPKRTFRIPDLIMKKRDGYVLTDEEIQFFIDCVCDLNNNAIQESQIGAMLMAIYHRSMNHDEAFNLTKAMMNSGARFDWKQFKGCVVDKHSTGGVGDKISLPLAPALAACGLKVPMISGRGLGFSGGTLDKLESIPGFQVNCSKERIEYLIEKVGCCIVGQTAELNPADRTLYATRDITGTVECIPLIAGSIVSKKAIEDLDALILDVKLGRAAFMKSQEDAELLADYMLNICRKLKFKAGVFLTRHDNPLGRCIGNQLEIEETIECLHGNLTWDIEELVANYGGYLLLRTDKVSTLAEGVKMIMEKLKNGEALEKFRQMMIEQGVSESVANELCYKRNYAGVFKTKAMGSTRLEAKKAGYVKSIDALKLGFIASHLGAGRIKAGDAISYEVGFRLLKTVGEQIEIGEPWIQVDHNTAELGSKFVDELSRAIEIVSEPVQVASTIVKIIDYM